MTKIKNVKTFYTSMVEFAIIRGIRFVWHMFSPRLPLPLREASPPRNTLFLGPSQLIVPNGISIGSAVLYGSQMPCYTMHCHWGRKPPKLSPSPWDFVTLPAKDRATAIGNVNKNLVLKIAHVVPEISSRTNRQTNKQTHTHTVEKVCNR